MTKCPRLFLAWENSRHFRRPHWFPREMTSVQWLQKFHTDDASPPRSDWLKQTSLAARPIRSTTQIWVVMRRHFAGKLVATSQNVYCFLRLVHNKLIIYNAKWQFITHDVTIIQWTPKWYTTTKITTTSVEVKSVGTFPVILVKLATPPLPPQTKLNLEQNG